MRLYPFSLNDSWELINEHRAKFHNFQRIEESEQEKWNSCVALAGGHPSLLIDGFQDTLIGKSNTAYQETMVSSIIVKLTTNHRVPNLPCTNEEAHDFIMDAIQKKVVAAEKHAKILGSGCGWYKGIENEAKNV